jgi:hypothetical protein
LLDLFVKNYSSDNMLYHNNGDGTFTDRAQAAGLAGIRDGAICSFADYDGDGFMDLLITGMGGDDRLFKNRGDGTFLEVTSIAGIASRMGGRGVAWGDYNNDGCLDLYIARGYDNIDGNKISSLLKNSLYLNNMDGTFTEVTDPAGVGDASNNGAAVWGDYDNDGLLDLFVANAGDGSGVNANRLYRNNGDGTFTDMADAEGLQLADSITPHEGAAWGDYDNDGFLDLVLKNGVGPSGGSHNLYRNTGDGNHYLKIELIGVQSNRQGMGAKVWLNTETADHQFREMNGGGGGELYSQGNEPIHFGLGAALAAGIWIQWPSGIRDRLPVAADTTITVVEGSTHWFGGVPKRQCKVPH